MRIRFWGTRGSIPVATAGGGIREKIKQALKTAGGQRFEDDTQIEQFINTLDFPTRHSYGGDTACVQIEGGPEYMLCDMGSGLRRFGHQMMQVHGPENGQVYHFLMSHVHWDHIQGLPFFSPAYIPGNTLKIYSCMESDALAGALARQHAAPFFPVDWNQLGANIVFEQIPTDSWCTINGFQVKGMRQPHPGDSFSYRVEQDGRHLVYATDAEHKQADEKMTAAVIAFYKDADMVIFDSMYSLADMVTIKEDWGHSSNIVGVDLCLRAGVKHYCMFHHEPVYDDEMLYTVLQETRRYAEISGKDRPLKITTAYDDMVIEM